MFFGWCGSEDKCTGVGAKAGQPCGKINGEDVGCEEGLSCAEAGMILGAGTCQKKGDKPVGSSCTSDIECAGTAAICDYTTQKCVSCS